MTVTIAAEAEADLEAIAGYIAADNPLRAVSFVQELVANCHVLAGQPLRHPIVADYGQRLRRFPYKGYSIYYQVSSANDVVVVHILNDAMDHRRILDS
ncbi:type II toxin-antitoxin system RelE/ParE family toxin [Devosia ginsengisoli]|uniref:type II toxin-antitoxin system RelE/ParE family toxin n=1 Tax=Devosia ginsengisoli TaxID=400770 RepID=UPI0026E94CA8|nr:type II toxin-antitoxin system RelE/ParE family toxin [Devosia ginsengisoli]MCR6672234.1 type II toxin-antitoxin system RelE/ParE family toxin [Devosia ginsengisoli]